MNQTLKIEYMNFRFGELATAYSLYRELTGSAYNKNTQNRFFEFLGMDFNSGGFITEEALKKIRWLNGPHAKTMYAIWKAQHGKGSLNKTD